MGMGWLMCSYQLVFLQLLLLHSLMSCANLCSHEHTSALLDFKQLFSSSSSAVSPYCRRMGDPSYPKMEQWKMGTDCCSWDGVTCDGVTGHVIGLDLSCGWLYGTPIPPNTTLFLLSHLQSLNLAYNDFNVSQIPSDFIRFPSLTHLNLSFCNFFGQVPAEFSHLSKLISLDLSRNLFSGQIPSFLSNFEQLTFLSLSSNDFSGKIPDIFINLTKLSFLDLSLNNLSGTIPSSEGRLQNLVSIYLEFNSFNGTIPSGLFGLPSLMFINLSYNELSGYIDEFQSNSLQGIYLSNNILHGPIPSSIFELVNLTALDLSSNNLSGTVEFYMFGKFKNLEKLDLSYNSLLLSTDDNVNSSFPQLNTLSLSSCKITEFPEILSTANKLLWLDLSDNKIHGHIPNWLFNLSAIRHLNLSHNYLTGGVEQLPWEDLVYLDLHSNLLQGPLLLLALPSSLNFFSVSHNKLTGVIPSSFCNLSSIEYLELSDNSLGGTVPQCLGNSTSILVLDLRMNNFYSNIPQIFANDSQLRTLNLNGNRFEGSLPYFLINCGNLEVLDVGNNTINDFFPHWLATLPQLQVLILRSNRFHGPLANSRTSLPFSKLRILDLSHNEFSGHLRTKFFKKFQAMMNGKNNIAKIRYMGDSYYRDSVMVTMKGIEIQMQRILTIFTTLDLSSNKFEGRIPDMVGELNSLKVLNFSHNRLIGHIPISLENLTELESLDISSNRLEGDIPIQLTSLTSLSALNLSYNQLVGLIPQGKQFNTFQNDSYFGNSGLCGLPLSKTCSNDEAPESKQTEFQEEQNTSSWFDWKIIMMGYGSGLVIGLSMGYIVFSTGKPWWYVRIVERKVIKMAERRRRRRN